MICASKRAMCKKQDLSGREGRLLKNTAEIPWQCFTDTDHQEHLHKLTTEDLQNGSS